MAKKKGGGVSARVGALEAQVSGLASSVDRLTTAMAQGQKTPWTTLIAMAGLLGGVFLFFSNLSQDGLRHDTARNTADIAQIQSNIVPRGEHEQHWQNTKDREADMQRQMDATDSKLGGTYSLRDAIQRLQSQMDEVRAQRGK